VPGVTLKNDSDHRADARAGGTEMAAVGFAELTIAGYMNSAIHFGGWLEARGVSLSDIDENTVKAFGAHRCQCPGHRRHKCLSRHYLARVERFAGYHAKRGVVRPVANTGPETPASLIAFRQWVLQHRGLSRRPSLAMSA